MPLSRSCQNLLTAGNMVDGQGCQCYATCGWVERNGKPPCSSEDNRKRARDLPCDRIDPCHPRGFGRRIGAAHEFESTKEPGNFAEALSQPADECFALEAKPMFKVAIAIILLLVIAIAVAWQEIDIPALTSSSVNQEKRRRVERPCPSRLHRHRMLSATQQTCKDSDWTCSSRQGVSGSVALLCRQTTRRCQIKWPLVQIVLTH